MDYLFWSILLLIVAVALVVLDVFIPSGGILSIFAVLSAVGAIVIGFSGGMRMGAAVLVATAVVLPLVVGLALRLWPHSPMGRLIMLQRPESDQDVLPNSEEYRGLKTLIGKKGIAKTNMLPSGYITVEGRSYDAVSKGRVIEEGNAIIIIDVETNRLIVRLLEKHESQPEENRDNPLAQSLDSLGLESLDDPLA